MDELRRARASATACRSPPCSRRRRCWPPIISGGRRARPRSELRRHAPPPCRSAISSSTAQHAGIRTPRTGSRATTPRVGRRAAIRTTVRVAAGAGRPLGGTADPRPGHHRRRRRAGPAVRRPRRRGDQGGERPLSRRTAPDPGRAADERDVRLDASQQATASAWSCAARRAPRCSPPGRPPPTPCSPTSSREHLPPWAFPMSGCGDQPADRARREQRLRRHRAVERPDGVRPAGARHHRVTALDSAEPNRGDPFYDATTVFPDHVAARITAIGGAGRTDPPRPHRHRRPHPRLAGRGRRQPARHPFVTAGPAGDHPRSGRRRHRIARRLPCAGDDEWCVDLASRRHDREARPGSSATRGPRASGRRARAPATRSVEQLQAAGIAAGAMNRAPDVLADPQQSDPRHCSPTWQHPLLDASAADRDRPRAVPAHPAGAPAARADAGGAHPRDLPQAARPGRRRHRSPDRRRRAVHRGTRRVHRDRTDVHRREVPHCRPGPAGDRGSHRRAARRRGQRRADGYRRRGGRRQNRVAAVAFAFRGGPGRGAVRVRRRLEGPRAGHRRTGHPRERDARCRCRGAPTAPSRRCWSATTRR